MQRARGKMQDARNKVHVAGCTLQVIDVLPCELCILHPKSEERNGRSN
jgi:hypothetical protein